MLSQLTILQASQATGLSADTLRFYERTGVLERVARAANGHRVYGEKDLVRITFIAKLRATGMTLDVIRRYAQLIRQGESTAEGRRLLLLEHRHAVAAKMDELKSVLEVIDHKIEAYRTVGFRPLTASETVTHKRPRQAKKQGQVAPIPFTT
jgi:DNA-binding transcriptional MerR regulator